MVNHITTLIYPPHDELNELEENYKIVQWRNGIQDEIRFTKTLRHAIEMKRRMIARWRQKNETEK